MTVIDNTHKFQNVTLKTTIHNLSPKPVIDNNN